MTDLREDWPPPETHDAPAATTRHSATRAVFEVCPFLRAEGQAWRSAHAAREHRCGAVEPPAVVSASRQRSLCLVPGHESCTVYQGARNPMVARETGDGAGPGLWPVVRSVPVVLESGRGILPSGGVTRTGGQMLLVVLMVVAFATLVFARLTGPGPGNSPSPGASGLIAASASPGTTPAPTPTATPPPSTPTPPPSATPSPAPSPTATPIPSGTRRYTVKSGDTLSAIAARFGTTVAAISAANNITDPRLIRPGQVLIIP